MLPDPPAQETIQTSVDAAIAIQPFVGTIEERVLECIRVTPCTDQEGQERTGLSGDTYRPRRRRLELDGKVAPEGTRRTRSGNLATVWRATRADEPPGTRRGPGVGTRSSVQAVATGQQQVQSTSEPAGDLWTLVRDTRPRWMTQLRYDELLSRASDAHPGDLGAALRQALAELRELGGVQ